MARFPHRLVPLAGVALALVALAGSPRRAGAAGFQIQEQSGRALGNAFVGEAASAEDASTIWFNPAGLTRLQGTQVVFGGSLIFPKVRFDNEGSRLSPKVGGGVLHGDSGGDGGAMGLVPTGYIAHQLSDRWRVGLGVNVPYGLRTDYDHHWVGRYHAVTSELKTVDIAPTFAVRLARQLSVGGGIDIQYAHAKLTNSLDMGSICIENAPALGLPPAICGALGLSPQSADGFVHLTGDSWAVGGNAGILWEPAERTRVGISFRTQMDHTLDRGTADFTLPQQAVILRKQSGALRDTGVHGDLNLPNSARFDVFQQLNLRWSVQAGLQWTQWSRFKELRFKFNNPKQPETVDPQNWDDSVRWGVAAQYRPARGWVTRLGFAYDYSPVPSAKDRTPRIPDSDRIWLSAGIGYQLTQHLIVDAGYAHLFSPNSDSNRADPTTGHRLIGTYSASADIIGGQATWQF